MPNHPFAAVFTALRARQALPRIFGALKGLTSYDTRELVIGSLGRGATYKKECEEPDPAIVEHLEAQTSVLLGISLAVDAIEKINAMPESVKDRSRQWCRDWLEDEEEL